MNIEIPDNNRIKEINNNNNNSNNNNNNKNNNNIYSEYENEFPNLNRIHKYHKDNEFFNDLNNERKNILIKQNCFLYSFDELGYSNNSNNSNNNNSNNNIQENQQKKEKIEIEMPKKEKIKYICTCPIEFDNIIDYENHYNSIHKNYCTICKKKSYPTYKLLECHILETHDTMFDLLCAKQKMFSCFVCDKMFWSDHSRKLHLVDYHKYPKDFYFHSKKREKELNQIRIKYINGKNNNNNSNNNEENQDKMEIDQMIIDLNSINTKDDQKN